MYKIDFKHIPSGIELFHELARQMKIGLAQCPQPCKTSGHMTRHDAYTRHLVDYDKGVRDYIVEIECAKCDACERVHAMLADVLVPHKTYCLIFILIVLKEYFHTRKATGICKKYGIAKSTLYAWRDRYLTHAALDLGAGVEAALLDRSHWLENAPDICRAYAPSDFFGRFGFSFLQYSSSAETTFINST
jgi:hypothetical protein